MKHHNAVQRVEDFPTEEGIGNAEVILDAPARRLGLWVLDPAGERVGEVTNAARLDEDVPRVIIALDENVRETLGLVTNAVDIEARHLDRVDKDTVMLDRPLDEILRTSGFDLG